MGKFAVKQTKTGTKFNLKAGNGEIILSSEVYASEKSCLNGIESVKKNADSEHTDPASRERETDQEQCAGSLSGRFH